MELPVSERYKANCGDYELTYGIITLLKDQNSGGFTVNIMNNLCNSIRERYIQVSYVMILMVIIFRLSHM